MSASSPHADCGLIYAASSPAYVAEAEASRRSARRHMPGIPATLFSPAGMTSPEFEGHIALRATSQDFCGKFESYGRTPYARTLFVDGDTHFCAPVLEIFDLLERFDFAAAHAPGRFTGELCGVPGSFCEFNTGIVAYRKGPLLDAVWAEALAQYKEGMTRGEWCDQPYLKAALYRSADRVRIATLPPEYNCRIEYPGTVKGPVKILHGRPRDFAVIEAEVNASDDFRSFLVERGYFRMVGRPLNRKARMLSHPQGGFGSFLRKVKNRLSPGAR
ncbi:MAG TPA: hypothetical protein VIM58_09375 [Candidatus Methylacidiphilales bacterium]